MCACQKYESQVLCTIQCYTLLGTANPIRPTLTCLLATFELPIAYNNVVGQNKKSNCETLQST